MLNELTASTWCCWTACLPVPFSVITRSLMTLSQAGCDLQTLVEELLSQTRTIVYWNPAQHA